MSKKSKQTQASDSEAGPWPYATNLAKGFVDKLSTAGGIGITPDQKAAFGVLKQNAAQGDPYAQQKAALANQGYAAATAAQTAGTQANAAGVSTLADANKVSQAGQQFLNPADRTKPVTDAYSTLQGQLGDYASGKYLDPMSNPQMQAMLQQVGDDVGNRVNAQFAGAGRDLSGANQMAYGKGVTAAQLPLLLQQWNQNQQNQMGAANSLFGAGNQTSQTLSGLDQARASIAGQGAGMMNTGTGMRTQGTNMLGQGTQFQQAGLNMGKDAMGFGQAALDAKNYSANNILDLDQQIKAMPYEDMSLMASLLFPAAGLGGTEKTTGTGRGKSGMFSDARLKEDIQEVGALADGQRVYKYAYKDDPNKTTHIGLLAQEARHKTPKAVGTDPASGFKVVEYDAATKKAAQILAARKGKKS